MYAGFSALNLLFFNNLLKTVSLFLTKFFVLKNGSHCYVKSQIKLSFFSFLGQTYPILLSPNSRSSNLPECSKNNKRKMLNPQSSVNHTVINRHPTIVGAARHKSN